MSRPRIPASELARSAYRTMDLYAPNRKPCAFDLSDNTNLAGLPPSARRVLAESLAEGASATFTRYPSLYGAELKRALADYLGVAPQEIVTGCGSDDVLDSAIRAFSEPGQRLAYPDPTFSMLPSFALMNGLDGRAIPLVFAGFEIDVDAFVESEAEISYVCTPNNPTGTRASGEALESLSKRARGVVIVDEAYIEYAEGIESFAKRGVGLDRVLTVRTLSKAFGMAGLRVGYGVGSPDLVAAVEKSRGPYKVSALAERMAVAALDNDREWVRDRAREVLESRARMEDFFRGLGLHPIASSANFLLVPVSDARHRRGARDAKEVARELFEKGIGIRPFPGALGIGEALRISVGPWSIMKETLAIFEEVLR